MITSEHIHNLGMLRVCLHVHHSVEGMSRQKRKQESKDGENLKSSELVT